MPVSCAAYGCTSRFNKENSPTLTFHKFPKDGELLEKWLHNVRRENFTPSKHTRLCSKHFKEEDFDRTSLSCVRLRSGAVPCIFEAFPEHLRPKVDKRRKPPLKRDVSEDQCQDDSSDDEHLLTNSNCPTETECVTRENNTQIKKLVKVESQLATIKKKIRVLQQSNRRLKMRNSALKSVVTELQKKGVS
ncbi:hypothetical protein Pmani_037873 [Petrolisthes manimaculis]|uniref:THAP-type domain-containing protein n=1 Tax=Petrolisthes manimaculis TaxID=1843537 RepID=A0AAE1NI61_9EUCA|nr:hypothetical protein Pmani_037873 [Petrolisthes manimaculis]